MPADPAFDILCPHGTGLPRHLAPPAEDHQSGNAGNPEFCRQNLLFLRVYLGQTNVRLQHLRNLLISRGHHLTGPAPGCPEIHDERNLCARNMQLEIRLRQGNGMSRKQRRMTLAAIGTIGQTLFRNAIDAPAMRADDMNSFNHT